MSDCVENRSLLMGFYNRDQAMKAHALLESVISKKYKWDREEKNWVKQSAGVVKQLYDTLRLL